MAKLRNLENRPVSTTPGRELHDRDIRELAQNLCREQEWTYEYHGGGRKPRLFNPAGDWMTLPLTPSSYGSVLSTYTKARQLGARLDDLRSAPKLRRRKTVVYDQPEFSHVETMPDGEWAEKTGGDRWWKVRYQGEPVVEPQAPEPRREPTPLPAATRELMARLARGTEVKDDARGDQGFTLADARRMLKDGYSLAHTIKATGWGRMWLDDLAERLDNG